VGDPLEHLGDVERACVERFVARLREVLGETLREVWLFGSFARGDAWSRRMPMNSDVDLLVVTAGEVPAGTRESLLDETYPLYLECGRQISPQYWSAAKLDAPPTAEAVAFKARLLQEGRRIPTPPSGRVR
jgi:hypothetical protein